MAPTLTLADAARPDELSGPSASAPVWSPDSKWMAYRCAGAVWAVLTGPTEVTEPTRVCDGVVEFAWLPEGGALLALGPDGALYHCAAPVDTPSNDFEKRLLITLSNQASDIGTSPDGSVLSYIVGGDLWLCPLASTSGSTSCTVIGSPRRITSVGVPPIASLALGTYYGIDRGIGPTPWGSSAPAYEWSADGRWICAHYVDRSNVRKVPFPYYLADETTNNVHRRAYPGEDSEIRRLVLIEVTEEAEGTLPLHLLKLGAPGIPDDQGCGFNTFSWRPSSCAGAELLVDVTSDTGQARAVYLVDPVAASEAAKCLTPIPATTLFHDWGEWRTYPSVSAGWLRDGSAAWLIVDAEEVHQLALIYPEKGNNTAQRETPPLHMVTDDCADVCGERGASVVTVSQGQDGTHTLFFTRNAPRPESRPIYSVTVSPSSPSMPQLRAHTTHIDGCHVPSSSPDGAWLASVHSDDVTPPTLSVFNVRCNSPQQVIVAPRPEMTTGGEIAASLIAPSYATTSSTDGRFDLRMRVLVPADGTSNGAAVVGPVYSNTVRNSWGRWTIFQQLLVQQGYTVLQVDVRGSTGNGRVFREEFVADAGGRDLDDLVAAAAYARTLPSVTTGRVGVWGSSYGGLITLMALFKQPGVFQAGVAAAPAVLASFYGPDDTAVVRRPAGARGQPDANYDKNSPMSFSSGLEDPLLLIHGMQDDIVPFKTTMMLIEKLMEEGKSSFELATAAAATHNWAAVPHVAQYLYGRLLAHFDRHLLLAGPKL